MKKGLAAASNSFSPCNITVNGFRKWRHYAAPYRPSQIKSSGVPNSCLKATIPIKQNRFSENCDDRWPDINFILLCGLEVFLISAKNLSKSSSLKRSPSWHTDTNKQSATEGSSNAFTLWFYLSLVEHKHSYSLFFPKRNNNSVSQCCECLTLDFRAVFNQSLGFMLETRWERMEWHVWSTTQTRPHKNSLSDTLSYSSRNWHIIQCLVCVSGIRWWSNLFEDGADCDGSRFEARNVAKLVIQGIVTFGVSPGKLCSSVNAAGFTWRRT